MVDDYKNARFKPAADRGAREPLSFERQVVRVETIKEDWRFLDDSTLRANIAYSLQKVHFDLLLLNAYNIYWALEAMLLKQAIVQIASVAEAVLQHRLRKMEDDPRVLKVLGHDWVFETFHSPSLPGYEAPVGKRVVVGVQRKVQKEKLDANTKMKMLIKAACEAQLIDDRMEGELDKLRELRNRIHIKSISEPEYDAYTVQMANEALELLEEIRIVAWGWEVAGVEAVPARTLPPPLPIQPEVPAFVPSPMPDGFATTFDSEPLASAPHADDDIDF